MMSQWLPQGIKNYDTVIEAPFFGQFRTGDPIGGR
jgi:hypothetical protein